MGSWLDSMSTWDTEIRGKEAVRGDTLVRHELDQENITVGHEGPGDDGKAERKREYDKLVQLLYFNSLCIHLFKFDLSQI